MFKQQKSQDILQDSSSGPKEESWTQEIRTFIEPEMPISDFLRPVRVSVSVCKL